MTKKEFRIANITLLIIIAASAALTFEIFSNESLSSMIKEAIENEKQPSEVAVVSEKTAATAVAGGCSKKGPLSLVSGSDPNIRRLATYQDVCGSFVTDRLMFFTGFPYDDQSASESAAFIASKLRQFEKNGISPIVIVEPYIGDALLSYREFIAGRYDRVLNAYFHFLQDAGITDAMMGTWVPFPESNTPNWNNKDTEPKDFALAVNKYLGLLKQHFPQASGSILLSAVTYEPDDAGWSNGDYLNLQPYLADIDKSLVDSFGIQGFPWVSNATLPTRQIYRATEFLQPDLAISAAQELRTKDIWINTGTFAAKYTDDETKKVEVSLNERKGILNGILETVAQIRSYQLNEYRVSVNLFSEDKSMYAEATDWSYFQNEDSRELLKEFLRKAEAMDIPVSLFDREPIEPKNPVDAK